MKKIIKVLMLFILISGFNIAQNSNSQLNMKMVITSPDTQIVTLNHTGAIDEVIEGYYFIPRYETDFTEQIAGLRPGGFSFLDPNMFGGIVEQLSEKWIKNKFPMQDIETMTNGMHIQKILSFQIKPVVVNTESDTLNLLIKYAVYDFMKQKDYDLNYTYNVKLFYKLVHILFNKEVTFDFIDKVFKDHKTTFLFTKEDEKYLTIKNDAALFTEIQKSANESKLGNINLKFDLTLTRKDGTTLNQFNYIAKYEEQNLPFAKVIIDEKVNEKVELTAKIYYSKLEFPFHLYNKEKAKRYKNYKTRGSIFQSTCNVYIIPIDFTDDSLMVDLFIDYTKLNLGDGIKRWTPIKKRIVIGREWKVSSITLPKENWSANFTRQGEQYDIYGYTDFERFINELLYIKVNKITHKDRNKL